MMHGSAHTMRRRDEGIHTTRGGGMRARSSRASTSPNTQLRSCAPSDEFGPRRAALPTQGWTRELAATRAVD